MDGGLPASASSTEVAEEILDAIEGAPLLPATDFPQRKVSEPPTIFNRALLTASLWLFALIFLWTLNSIIFKKISSAFLCCEYFAAKPNLHDSGDAEL